MIYSLGILLVVLFAMLAALHIYWAVGGRWGSDAVVPTIGGKRQINPTGPATFLVGIALFLAMLTILGKLGLVRAGVPAWIFSCGTWFLAAIFLIRVIGDFRLFGVFKRVRDTRFARWDTWLFCPLCLLISLVSFILADRLPG
jgi:hypothetical protein